MKAFEAARILFQNNEEQQTLSILKSLWLDPSRPQSEEFEIFCALIEVCAKRNSSEASRMLETVMSEDAGTRVFWGRRSLAEQAILLDWLGQIHFYHGDFPSAHEVLSRSASLGRDTSLIWKQLGEVYLVSGELDLGIRYIRRSLHLFRQLDLKLHSGREFPMGFFGGTHPLGLSSELLEDYLGLLLKITKLAKGQRSLKSVRELVVEMIHQFPEERRLPKIRLLLERAVVESSVGIGNRSPTSPSRLLSAE